ncbi:MBL fold metallo-hydrolase [Dolosigranulum pigrum]|uniref:MBL fold metallo-hydrolase n=1 Tax=Dolosigranulum pigrum TaxID=29394 RepID=UPI001AD869F0|nr:MBL fold metallo-hydrolase [Dolosigranulum pigrum]QTJ38717.1 MBL fold metallo-hydrolase [Dolosigranulum pigrum]
MRESRVVMLGTGTPNPTPERMGPCAAVIVDEQAYLVDFGVGLVRQAATMVERGIEALAAAKLTRGFLTHLHSDHTLGLPDLILTPWVLKRSEPLKLFGPAGTETMVDHLLKAYAVDIQSRQDGLEQANQVGIQVEVTEIDEGVVYQDERVTVEAFRVNHPPFEAYGYKFICPDKVIVFSGDTTPTNNIIQWAQGCDILVHEVFSAQGVKRRSPVWRKYHTSVHTSSVQLGELASQIKPRTLVLNHQLFFRVPDAEGQVISELDRDREMIREIQQNYRGEVISARDGDVVY